MKFYHARLIQTTGTLTSKCTTRALAWKRTRGRVRYNIMNNDTATGYKWNYFVGCHGQTCLSVGGPSHYALAWLCGRREAQDSNYSTCHTPKFSMKIQTAYNGILWLKLRAIFRRSFHFNALNYMIIHKSGGLTTAFNNYGSSLLHYRTNNPAQATNTIRECP